MSKPLKYVFFQESSLQNKKLKKKNITINNNQNVSENKENISINLNKKYEEENISSSKKLKTKEKEKIIEIKTLKEKTIKENSSSEKEKDNKSIPVKPISLSKKNYDKYCQKMKEKTMRMEIEKIYNETERLKQKYDDNNSNFYFLDNNTQFQKIYKKIKKQLLYILLEAIIINIFSSINYFIITNEKEGISLSNFCLSISLFAMSILLLILLKMGLLKDPYISRTFRFFVIIEFLLLISSFFINIISGVLSSNFIKRISSIQLNIIIYTLLLSILVLFFIILKYCINLFIESLLIILQKKTEYCILLLKEKNNNKVYNVEDNLTTSMSTDNLYKTTNDLINDSFRDRNKSNIEEEKYRNYNFFNKFHYSVSSERKKDLNRSNIKKFFNLNINF